MCSLLILRRPGHDWPLLVAANRDERRDRPWLPPAQHWPDRPEVVAGLDERALGTWFGVNDHGVVAAVMNREGTLGPDPVKRSRGELVLEALDHAEANEAARALADLDPHAYRGFNLFVGDPVSAWWLRHRGDASESIEVFEMDEGLHMLTARELDDATVPRIAAWLPRFRKAPAPNPETGDWQAWQALLASREHPGGSGPEAAMNIDLGDGFGTVCSQCAAVPRYPGFDERPRFLFAEGPPDTTPFRTVEAMVGI